MSTPLRTRPGTALRRSGAALVVALLALPLAGCGDRADDPAGSSTSETTASDPVTPSPSSPTGTPTPTESETEPLQQSGPIPVTGDAGVEEAVVVSASEVGGDVSPLAFPLETRQERQDFGAAFDRGFGGEVSRAVRSLDAPAGTMPWGTVAAVGCEPPDSVRIDAGEAGFEVTPRMPKTTVQCLVPVTYVVVFAAPTA